MGIQRFHIRCAGCKEIIRLRLTVGTDENQPFYFPCPVCGAPSRGLFRYLGGTKTDLTLESGELLLEDVADAPSVSISADIPSIASARQMHERGGSAFMHFARLVGLDQMQRFIPLADTARAQSKRFGPVLARLISYYRTQDWQRFDSNLKDLLPEGAPLPTKNWQRSDVLHRAFDLLLLPVLAVGSDPLYPEMKAEWNGLWSSEWAHHEALLRYAERECRTATLLTCQRDLLMCLERYLSHMQGILPGALCNMVPDKFRVELDELRLFRDDFEALRDLYINGFEACHRAIRWIVAAANVAQRGDEGLFPASARSAVHKTPKSPLQFDKLPSANKRLYLLCLPTWDKAWDSLLDRPLRNDFGHASARHDLTTGMLHRDGRPDLRYHSFLQRVHLMGHALLACANALKVIQIYGCFRDS